MRISDFRLICEPPHEEERNIDICKRLNYADEALIYHVDREILNYDKNASPLKNIDSVFGDQAKMDADIDDILEDQTRISAKIYGRPWYNTWPFGTPTEEIYSKFLAVCRGKRKLKDVFDVVVQQSKKIAKHYPISHGQDKTVMILTDKWDYDTFRKYEKKLLNHAIQDGIWYIFLLVTDYGYTQIPFLPNNRNALKHLDIEKIEEDLTYEDILDMLCKNPFEYSMSGGTWQQHEQEHYSFDPDELRWEKYSLLNGNSYGKIRKNDLKRFLKSVSWIADESRTMLVSQVRTLDAPTRELRIFGKTIEWDAGVGEDSDSQYALLQKDLDRFVLECEKHADTCSINLLEE